jgi:hypothetical protein
VIAQKFGDGGQAVAVAEVVLRESARPNGDVGKDGFGGDGKDARDFMVDEICERFGGETCGGRIGGTADKTCKKSMALGSATREERRIPDRAENAEAGRTRHEETESIERVSDFTDVISKGNDGDGSVLHGSEERFE